jgi:hypothetical protein
MLWRSFADSLIAFRCGLVGAAHQMEKSRLLCLSILNRSNSVLSNMNNSGNLSVTVDRSQEGNPIVEHVLVHRGHFGTGILIAILLKSFGTIAKK